jgi:hypothetical protein
MACEFQPGEGETGPSWAVSVNAAERNEFADSHRFELAQSRFGLRDCIAQPQIRVVIGAAVEETAIAREIVAEAQLFVFNDEHNPLQK